MPEIHKYTEEDGITFLLDNDNTVTLKTNYTGIGAESIGKCYVFKTSYNMSNDDVAKLKNNKVIAVRITYLGGKFDREIKKEKQKIIMDSLELFD